MSKQTATAKDRTTLVERDLETMHRYAVDLLAQQGLREWSVFWEYLLEKSDGGGVTYSHAKRIIFSAAHVALLTPPERRDAVRHEVAHAIVGAAAAHSELWRSAAIELGGSGAESHTLSALLYPWYGLCPSGHPTFSMRSPAVTPFVCEDDSHEEPLPVERWKRNSKSRVHDPGVMKMAAKYPEPASTPVFQVGETVYVIPYGSEEYDNAPLTVLKVNERDYSTRHLHTGEEISARHEMVSATRISD